MKLLAIDSSSAHIVSGIVEVSGSSFASDGDVVALASSSAVGATQHAEVLAPSIADVAARAGVELSGLDGVVVGLGPGPFTGLRVGIVTAAALGDALGLPVWGVCSLDAVAATVTDGRVLAVSDARRKEVYYASYDAGRRVAGPDVRRPEDLTDRADLLLHAGASKYLDAFAALAGEVREAYATPENLVRVALRDGLLGGPPSVLEPIYLRRPDAAEPKAKPKLNVTGPGATAGGSTAPGPLA